MRFATVDKHTREIAKKLDSAGIIVLQIEVRGKYKTQHDLAVGPRALKYMLAVAKRLSRKVNEEEV